MTVNVWKKAEIRDHLKQQRKRLEKVRIQLDRLAGFCRTDDDADTLLAMAKDVEDLIEDISRF